MAEGGVDVEPERSWLTRPAVAVVGLLAVLFGVMGTFVGGILLSMCLVGDGILCSGTMIGDMGLGAVKLGLPLLLAGLGLWIPMRRAVKRLQEAQMARAGAQRVSDRARTMRVELAVARGAADVPAGPVSSKCPECGGPVERDARECPWCGQPFV